MQKLLFVPGFGGSQLHAVPPDVEFWVSAEALGRLGLYPTRLADNGISPAPMIEGQPGTEGLPLYALGNSDEKSPVNKAYGGFFQTVLELDGYEAFRVPWDWRQSLTTAGQKVVDAVIIHGTDAQPVSIVAHSAGGLAVRLAWKQLGVLSKRNLVRRIILFNVPNFGTYQALELLQGNHDTVDQVLRYRGPFVTALGQLPMDRGEAIGCVATWPCIYQLLPFLWESTFAGDPLRARLFEADRWRTTINAHWLEDAGDFLQPLFDDAQTVPPFSVLTTIAGVGYNTSVKLARADWFGSLGYAYASPVNGDGYSSTSSQHLDTARQIGVPGDHVSVINGSITRNSLQGWLDEEHVTPGVNPPNDQFVGPAAKPIGNLPLFLNPSPRPTGSISTGGDP